MLGATCSTRTLVAWAIAAVPVALATRAVASESLGVVAVAPPPGPSASLLEATEVLRGRIAERHAGTLDVEHLRARSAPPRSVPLPELERAFDQARLAYLEGDVERSMRALRQIAEALERLPGGPEVQALWTKVVMRIARTELDLGRRDDARATLARLLRGVPDLAVDPALVPARLVEELERERAALQALPVGTLVVSASIPGAQVFVNGRGVGAAPVRVGVPRGRCRVVGTTETSQVGPIDVEVGEASQEVLLDFTVPEALRPWSGQGLAARAEERQRLLLAVGDHLALDRVVGVAFVAEGGATYLLASLYDVRRRVMEREARLLLADGAIPRGGDAALAEFIVSGHTESPLVQVPGPPALAAAPPPAAPGRLAIAQPAERSSPAASPALQWSPVVTAVGAVAFTTAAVLQLHSASDSYDRATRFRAENGLGTFHNVSTYNGYVAEGDAAKGRAALYWTGAGICFAATAILGYVNYRRTGELGPLGF
jgi:hypothetical protein